LEEMIRVHAEVRRNIKNVVGGIIEKKV